MCDNPDINAYLDRLNLADQPTFSLPKKRRSGDSVKENIFTQGSRINSSPRRKRVKKRKLSSSTTDDDDEELNNVLNEAKGQKKTFLIDENENAPDQQQRKETVKKRFIPVVPPPRHFPEPVPDDIDFSGEFSSILNSLSKSYFR